MSSPPIAPASAGSATRPYLVRALHDWCTDNGFTPYVAVFVDASVRVPAEYVKNNEIVLNVGFEATSGLKLGNDFIEFKARFGGSSREIMVPMDHVIAIYARENGQGMAFPAPGAVAEGAGTAAARAADIGVPAAPVRGTPRLALTDPNAGAKGAPANAAAADLKPAPPPEPPAGGRPSLKRVK